MVYEQLSALDSAFLYLERNGPVNVGSLAIVEGGRLLDGDGQVRVSDIQRHLAGRLHLVPRFRQAAHGGALWLRASGPGR